MVLKSGVICALATLAVTATAVQARPLKVVGPWEIAGIDPAQSGYVFSRMQVAETLVSVDPAGKLIGGLASSWSSSEDGLTWRFVLRKGATFHDGNPVTPSIVADALRRVHEGTGVFSQVPVAAVEADGDAVVVKLSKPFAALPAYLVNFTTIVLAPSSFGQSGKVEHIVGSGPYRVKSLTPPLNMQLEASSQWTGEKPAIAEVDYQAVGQGETRALMAESGEADLVFSMLPVSVDRLKRNPKLDVKIATIPRTRLLKVNAASPFFSDVRVRRAISNALDREGISKVILRNPDLAATQLFPKALAGWYVPDLPPLTRDLPAAKALLAEAGWTPGPDGVLQKDGQRFSFKLLTYASWPELPPIATAIQAQLREAGIEAKVSVGNSSEIPAGHKDGSLEMGLVSRLYSIVPDAIGTLRDDYKSGGSDWGATGWSNNELNALVEQMAVTTDPEKRAPMQKRAVEILQSELPSIPVTWSELAIVSNKRIAGVRIDPLEVNYGLASIRWAQ
ncbi:ABC transporter substrate-binding protein [Chelatococcus asaccharovorans]|uniref:Peptide/nickel transport system substrate-binding protein n=1 Tax=Chelatococcus asaccharovorans TaxID=28210 RepID=A0A2V3TWP8_9HYPH|nr:ABC transporter substrate-binding protein [Chelatococcus asaccharovorans]MBS7705100.1 ABC transporter substrate-binding protein [Chelatococcus asaccharovorans]PXW53591.1 peptide/nickel transport system substrate-binding protein [Chelatococcus asaccharovorans]CAH1652481.1 Peptide/nickel transport system substrate-binding protein [Chelatococcus asaccharovorans]CAH1686325.1 Peptide/nickel transport system substrate-binding protein [Chelatococcus asaccharovorans]